MNFIILILITNHYDFFFNNDYFYIFCIIKNFINILNVFKHELLYVK